MLFGVTNVHDPGPTEAIEFSLTEWVREGLLEGGAFVNVSSGALLETPRPGVTARTVYQSPRGDLVWESGVAYSPAPTRPSGVYVDGIFRPFGSGVTPDYLAGSVTFSSGLPAGSAVRMNYAHRSVRVYNPRHAPWYYQLQLDSYDQTQAGSGVWAADGRNRLQLPAVVVSCRPRAGNFAPHELGSLQREHRQEVILEVVAERAADRDRLHDALVGQWQRRVDGIDLKNLRRDGREPLTPAGEVNPSGLGSHAAMAARYPWTQIRVAASDSHPVGDDRPRLFRCAVRWTVELDLPTA